MKRTPPLVVKDLFEDIKDGVMLLALLETLSGQKLPCEQGRQLRRIHWVSNVGTALKFLEGRRIKLVNINATDIVDGRPSIVLGLMWTIILYFQVVLHKGIQNIEELTSSLPAMQALSSSTSSVDSVASSDTASPPIKKKSTPKSQVNARKALLTWVQRTVTKDLGVEVKDFGPSWRTGVAFHAVIHAIRPELVNMDVVRGRSNRENLEDAFSLAEDQLGIPRLLDPEDVDVDKPDDKSIMTYVAQFLKHYPGAHTSEPHEQQEEREQRKVLREMKTSLEQLDRDLIQAQGTQGSLAEKYQSFKAFRVKYEMCTKQIDTLLRPMQQDGKLTVDQALAKQAWDHVSSRFLDWHLQLDRALPDLLGTVGAWLHQAEAALQEEVAIGPVHEETSNNVHRTLEQHKELLMSLEEHHRVFQQIHRDRSVNGVPVHPEQLQDMAERFNHVSMAYQGHLRKLEFWEMKYRVLAFLVLAESKLKTWVIKYSRQESVELLLESYTSFMEEHRFMEQYEITYGALKRTAEAYVQSDSSAEQREGLNHFLSDTSAQWKQLCVELRSVRSMLQEVLSSWERYGSSVAALQAWLEDAERKLAEPESTKREFFQNLPHWIQQHATMNDAGNFLIETCDETVSLELKQQLLLLNGRWRELFVRVKQYAQPNEVDRMRKDLQEGLSSLSSFLDLVIEKMSTSVQVSFLNVRSFVQDLEDIKQKLATAEAQYEKVSHTAQLLAKDTPQEEAAQMRATVATVKDQLNKVREKHLHLQPEAQALLAPLEEMEKHITSFYESLERASVITVARDSDTPGDYKHKCQCDFVVLRSCPRYSDVAVIPRYHGNVQALLTCQQTCSKCLSAVEHGQQSLLRTLSASGTLRHFDTSLLQKRVLDLQGTLQTMVQEAGEWRKHVEANSGLMRRFDESRVELEKVLKAAQVSLKEQGNPEELLEKHTEFFGQIDQRVLSAFLKACDELTDILPEGEHQGLQETVRRLHKQWKDVHTEAPFHLLRLRVHAGSRQLLALLQDCQVELERENDALPTAGSERLVREHRAFFKESGPQAVCEKRLQDMEELCGKLPEGDPAHQTTHSCRVAISKLAAQVDNTYQVLLQHPDKWEEFTSRCSMLDSWISSKESQLRELKVQASDPDAHGWVKTTLEEMRRDAEEQQGNLGWLETRLAALMEVCLEGDFHQQRDVLTKLSSDHESLLSSLAEVEDTLLATGARVQVRAEILRSLEELQKAQKQVQKGAAKILEAQDVKEAQQMLLSHQKHLEQLRAKRSEAEQQVLRVCHLQTEEKPSDSLQMLERVLHSVDETVEQEETILQETLAAWQDLERQLEALEAFVSRADIALRRDCAFSSLEGLTAKLEQARDLHKQSEEQCSQVELLLKEAAEIRLGSSNRIRLQEQTRVLQKQVGRVRASVTDNAQQLETIKSQWEEFNNRIHILSTWISERGEELVSLRAGTLTLQQQESAMKAVEAGLQERTEVLPLLETESCSLGQFISPEEAARMRARLMQVGQEWEELQESVERVGGDLEQRTAHLHRFTQDLEQARTSLQKLGDKLEQPVTSCASSSDAYRALEDHQDEAQSLEQLRQAVAALSGAAQRLSDREQAEGDIVALQHQLEEHLRQAGDKQVLLENLQSLWQRYEKELSSLMSWLERSEFACSPVALCLSVDKTKLQTQLCALQDLQSETVAQESFHQDLLSLAASLHLTASREQVKELSAHVEQLEERWREQVQMVLKRMQQLQTHMEMVEQFEQTLAEFSHWSKSFLSDLHTFSQVDITDLVTADTQTKEAEAMLQNKEGTRASLEQRVASLSGTCNADELPLLRRRWDTSLQPCLEAQQLLEHRRSCLGQLEAFLEGRGATASLLQGTRQALEGAGSFDRAQAEPLRQELESAAADVCRLDVQAVSLDSSLSKARWQLCGEGAGPRITCRALVEALTMSMEDVQNLLGTRQSEAEALGALWTAFRQRKEQLLLVLREVEEKASGQSLQEPSLQELQHRLRFFNELEEELLLHQHEVQWVRERGQQLAQRDAELAGEALREVGLVEIAWEEAQRTLTDRQAQSSLLLDNLRDFQNLKSSINNMVEKAAGVAEIRWPLKDQEDVRRELSRHEAAKMEMGHCQEELDLLTSRGKHLLGELSSIPDCEPQMIKQDLDAVLEQWLDVSERIDDNIKHLGRSAALWAELQVRAEDIDSWAGSVAAELSKRVTNLSDSQQTEQFLSELQVEMQSKEQELEAMHENVCELKELTCSQDTPTQLQVLEAKLRKKLEHIQGLLKQTSTSLEDFCSQKQELENFISQMTRQLQEVEDSLSALPQGPDEEDICRVKEHQKELQALRINTDSMRDSLGSLCRRFPTEDLVFLGTALADLSKRSEAAHLSCSRTLGSLQDGLQQHFTELVNSFHMWLLVLKEGVKECSDQSGDIAAVRDKLQRLKGALEQVDEGKGWLTRVCEEGKKLLLHLPKTNTAQVHQQISTSQQEWVNFVEQCHHNQRVLEEVIAQLDRFETRLEDLSEWLQQKERGIHAELSNQSQHLLPETEELEKMEVFVKELLKERDAFDRLCREAQSLSEAGRGAGGEVRAAVQLQTQHQALLKSMQEQLRSHQLALQEHRAFEESLHSAWAWLKDLQDRLADLDNTIGSRTALEQRLVLVQDVLLLKSEGEVKLNMAVGKAEQLLRSSRVEPGQEAEQEVGQGARQEAIRSQLQELKDAWTSMQVKLMGCHSRLQWTVSQCNSFKVSEAKLLQWMEVMEREAETSAAPPPGLKEKAVHLERLRAALADVEHHEDALSELTQLGAELRAKTADSTFREEACAELRVQFDDIAAIVKDKVRQAEESLVEHERYAEAVRDLTDWLASAREELQRWAEPTGDPASLQRRLTKVQELIDSRQQGRERLRSVQRSTAFVPESTDQGGPQRAWEEWEGAALRARDTLRDALARADGSEREFRVLEAQLEQELETFRGQLCALTAVSPGGQASPAGAAQCFFDTVEGLLRMEPLTDSLQSQLNSLCRFPKDLHSHSERVSSLIKEYNSLQAAKECQNKEKFLEQQLRTAFRDFQQWLVNAKINTAKCFDVPQSIGEASAALLKVQVRHNTYLGVSVVECRLHVELLLWVTHPRNVTFDLSLRLQEFLSDKEQGQSKLDAVVVSGELLSSIVSKDRVDTIQAKVTSARDDWKSFISNLLKRETALQNLQAQMKDLESSAEPLQSWLTGTESAVQESSTRLHDLSAKRQELHKLQVLRPACGGSVERNRVPSCNFRQGQQSVLEEIASQEGQLSCLREKALLLWEGQAAGKAFMHRVGQLSAQYLALSNLTKEKASRVDRIVSEHQLFSQGLKELQGWVVDANDALQTFRSPTADKNVLDQRMIKLEALLATRQEKEIQLKMLITRGESVQRNTSPEGVPVVRKQIQDLKDSWDSLLSASIQCKSQLEGALSQWTSYQEDVRHFLAWMEAVEMGLGSTDKQYSEMRDKTANLGKAKLLYEEVLSHRSPLETIAMKGADMSEHGATQLEVQELQERYAAVRDKAKAAVSRAEELVLTHQEYQRGLHILEDWLEQEQERLGRCSTLEGNVEALESTLQELQELQERCSAGEALMASVLASREQVIPWGLPQIEDRALETVQQDWQSYQARLTENLTRFTSTLDRLRQMEQQFRHLDCWLTDMEAKSQMRSHRRSDRTTKEHLLQQHKGWQEEALRHQEQVEGLAQQVLEEVHLSSHGSAQAAQLTARYHALLLQLAESVRQLQEEIRSIEEAHGVFSTFSDWLSTVQKRFQTAVAGIDLLDRVAMERKMKELEVRAPGRHERGDVEQGHSFLKAMREKTERASSFLGDTEAEELRAQVAARLSQLEGLMGALRVEHSGLEKHLLLAKEFLDKYKAQAQWVAEMKAVLSCPVEAKAELFQKKAQLAKYKVATAGDVSSVFVGMLTGHGRNMGAEGVGPWLQSIQLMVESHEAAVSCVVEKGGALLDSVCDTSISNNVARLQEDYQELHATAVMSRRMVVSDPTQSSTMEGAAQQLAGHKALMEEVAGFEERLSSLKERGDELVASCADTVQARLRQQIQAHQQGTRDSYSAICSTAQRVYQSLDRELQKHVGHQDALLQCQAWLSTVQEELLDVQPPVSLQEALQQVKHDRALQEQASTYLDLVCSVCDLSEGTVRDTASKIQQIKIILLSLTLQIEERMSISQDLAESWREIREQRTELEAHFQDVEQQLQNLSRRPAELELKIAENMLLQAKEFLQQLQADGSTLTHMTENVSRLTEGRDSPEHTEVEKLHRTWQELCLGAENHMGRMEEDVQRARAYHKCISEVEMLFGQMFKEWDILARTDTENSSEHLEELRKLATLLEEQRVTLDKLKDQRQKVIQHLNLEDKELVKEQVGHFEQRWAQLEGIVKKKIQDSALMLEDLCQVESRLREAREWVEEQQPALSEAMKMSPPPELAQSFLFDHLSICSELEAKQLVLTQAMSDADRLLANLGLDERQRLQQLITDTQAELDSLSTRVVQRRKNLSKAFTEKTQFLQALGQAMAWIQQNRRKALVEDHVALLPDDLSKQARLCRCVQSSLRAYQSELASLWSQGRDLMKNATEDEKAEMLAKLQELQNMFEAALQKCAERLQELEKILVSRKYFKMDLDRTCQWLKQADIVTFPEINMMSSDTELYLQLTKYQRILEQATEYENLLLIVQRAGQEILPTLNQVDHCYLDEKLNALPQQYNNILALAKEKREQIQQTILGRKEYASFIEVTFKAVKELEDQFAHLEKQPVGLEMEELVQLRDDYKSLLSDLTHLGLAVSELNQKKEGFCSTGQPWRPKEIAQLVSLHRRLERLLKQRVAGLDGALESFEEHRALLEKFHSELNVTKDQVTKVKTETQLEEEGLKKCHTMAGSLQEAGFHLKRLMEKVKNLDHHVDPISLQMSQQQADTWQEELQSLQAAVRQQIMECEDHIVQSRDFETEARRTLNWLRQVKDELNTTKVLDVEVEKVKEEIRKQQTVQEEMQSRLRIVAALSTKERQKFISANEQVPDQMESSLEEMAKMEAEATLQRVLELLSENNSATQAAGVWLDKAQVFLEDASFGVDVEKCEEILQEQDNIVGGEHSFLGHLHELQVLTEQLKTLICPSACETFSLRVNALQQKGVEISKQLRCHQDLLSSCVTQWKSYQDARQATVDLMNEAEQKLVEFSTAKAATSQEAWVKLQDHKALISLLDSFRDGLAELEERAVQLGRVGSDASRASLTRSVTAAWQRWTRLRTIAQEQEKSLEATAHEWSSFEEKMDKVRAVAEDLQGRVPDGSVEKASKASLQTLLEYHDSFTQEVEREHSALALLRQYALSLPQAMPLTAATPISAQTELPVVQEIQNMQEHYDSLVQQVRRTRAQVQQELKEQQEVERELGLVKSWVQDVQGLLLSAPTDEDSLLQELEVVHKEVLSHRKNVEKIAEQQHTKYLDLNTILPSEMSMQIAEVTLALSTVDEQMRIISVKLKEKATDISQAKEETKALREELESCGQTLVELDGAVRDFGEQNPLLSRQLVDAVAKLSEIHHHTARLADYRTIRLKKASSLFHEFNEMLQVVVGWTERAEVLLKDRVVWSSSSQLQEQISIYQLVLQESRDVHVDLDAMTERASLLSEVLQADVMSQQVSKLSRHTEELQQNMRTRLQSLQDALKDMEKLEQEVSALHEALESAQVTLTSPELAQLSLKEQLAQRQHLLADMENLKQQVQAMQVCQSALRVPEEAVTSLPICRTALGLTHEASQLQHTAIQQCNILQELAQKIRGYQEQIASLNSKCKMLTVKAKHATMLLTVAEVEELSEGLDELDPEVLPEHPGPHSSVVMMTAGRCHTLLSPVTEESGEEGTNSEISSPPACRSPSPVANADASLNQEAQVRPPTTRVPLQDLYDSPIECVATTNLDDLQRSWETLKNVNPLLNDVPGKDSVTIKISHLAAEERTTEKLPTVKNRAKINCWASKYQWLPTPPGHCTVISEKQKTLYEALERQQSYQDALQSISTKMESVEVRLNKGPGDDRSPESQMAAHQALMDDILMLQDEINELQACFAEELSSDALEADTADQLAMQSTLTVLAERMATIRMKASGKRQLLEDISRVSSKPPERLSDQLEEQRQAQALQRYHSEADELDHWLLSTRAALSSARRPRTNDMEMDMEEQLIDCQEAEPGESNKRWVGGRCLFVAHPVTRTVALSLAPSSTLSERYNTALEASAETPGACYGPGANQGVRRRGRLRTPLLLKHLRADGGMFELASLFLLLQNMLLEMEQKVTMLSELSVHSESLLLEGGAHTRHEAEQLALKLHTLKDSLLELQRMLQDKQLDLQGSVQEQDVSEPDSGISQNPSIQDWLSQARSSRCQHHLDDLQRQKELGEHIAQQKELLQFVTSVGEELLSQQTTPTSTRVTDSVPPKLDLEHEGRLRLASLSRHLSSKLQLLQDLIEQEASEPVFSKTGRVSLPSSAVLQAEPPVQGKSSLKALFRDFNQAIQEASSQPRGPEKQSHLLQERLYAALSAATSWLDGVESSLFSGPVLLTQNAETRLYSQEVLQKDVQEVEEEVARCKELMVDSQGLCGKDQALMEEALNILQVWLGAMASVLEKCCENTRSRLQEFSAFQTELRLLFTALAESKQHTVIRLAEVHSQPTPKQTEIITEAEESLRELEQRVTELKYKGETLQPDQICTQELLKLQEAYEEVVEAVGLHRSSLNQNLTLKAQGDQALQDLVDLLDTAQDKMAADQKMMASSVEEVHSLLDKHKEFFQGLESHMILTESLFLRIQSFMKPWENQALEETLAQVQGVLKQAHKRGVELEHVLESWSHLEEKYQALLRQLEAVEANIPTVGLVEETEERLAERIDLYQSLKGSLAEWQPELYQVLEDGKRLLLTVCCSGLEQQLTQLAEHWLSCTTRVNKELHRLDSTLKHCVKYQSESAQLNQWLRSALERLEFWAAQSVTVPMELETVRDHLYAFLGFSKEVDAKSSLKASVLSTGSQLLRLKRVDTATLRSALAQLDTQWAELMARIPVVQEKLHQLQMEKLASRHAITELMSWISLMEKVIEEDEEKINEAVGSEVIQGYLQKYKGFKIDLNCKQLTVDFVNQSVLQISSQDVESKRSDKTDFAERLGAMNRRWQILQGLISEKTQLLEGLLESWMEYENSLQNLKTWFDVQEDKLKKKQQIEDLASVQNALKDCQELEEMIKKKQKDVGKVEEQGHSLILNKKEEAGAVVLEAFQDVSHTWANLDHLTEQLKMSLQMVLDQWNLYKCLLEEINGYLMEGRYSVSRFRLLTGSLEAVRGQNLQEELEKQENSLRKFSSITQQLLKECQTPIADELNYTLNNISLRWNGLMEEVTEQLRSSKALQQLWQRYQELYSQTATAIQQQEEQADGVLEASYNQDFADKGLLFWVQKCSELLQAQQPIQNSLQVLHELGEQLRGQVDSSAIAALQSDHFSLTQRLAAVEKALCRQQAVLQAAVQDCERFSEQLDSLNRCVVEAELVLKGQDPSDSTEQSIIHARMEELKGQILKLSSMTPDLQRLNELGYRLPLSDTEIKHVQKLNRDWAMASAQATERLHKLQSIHLEHQTFSEKCKTWMEFLAETEERLVSEICGNYQSLLEQQRAHEAEMLSQHQILRSMVNEGQQPLEQGDINEREEFYLKLTQLSSQWQGMVHYSQHRRGTIDLLVRHWQQYREMFHKLHRWLADTAQQVDGYLQGVPVPLQQIHSMLDEVQRKEKAMQRQQGCYIMILEVGRHLLLSADSRVEAELQAELTDMQERWRHVSTRLDECRREMDHLLKVGPVTSYPTMLILLHKLPQVAHPPPNEWDRCEKGIGGLLEKLRAFKRKLSLPLPDHQDALHSEQMRCK
ncbi:nesprin-1-like, partial [Scleropages formosus]